MQPIFDHGSHGRCILVMHHVTERRKIPHFEIGKTRLPATYLVDAVLALKMASILRLPTQHQQGRCPNASPTGFGLVATVEHGIGESMPRIEAQHHPIGRRPRPDAGHEMGNGAGQSWIATLQLLGQAIARLVVRFFDALAQLIEPFGESIGRAFGVDSRQTEALEGYQATDTLRPHAGIECGNVAAHAVPDQRRGPITDEEIEHGVEITEVVRKPVGRIVACAAAEAAPIWRHEVQPSRQGIDQKLEGIGAVLKAVQQKNRGCLVRSPMQHAVRKTADLDHLLARLHDGFVSRHRSRSQLPRNRRYAGFAVSSIHG